MSPNKRSTVVHTMFITQFQPAVRAAYVVLLAAAAILTIGFRPGCRQDTWNAHSANDIWSTAGNWSVPAVPSPPVTSSSPTPTAQPSAIVNNIVDANFIINTLQYNNVLASPGNYQTTQINAGKTLNIIGNLARRCQHTGQLVVVCRFGHWQRCRRQRRHQRHDHWPRYA